MADRYNEAKALCRPGMSVEDARRVVDFIREQAGDDEVAHAFEDRLRDAVLEVLAASAVPEVAALARVALSTRDIEFSRWCA